MTELVPFALKDTPTLIEKIFPGQKISVEAQKERKAGSGQTLTGLGSYWKGRKPLIMTRAIVLASLLPATDDLEADLDIYEKLMAIDDESFMRRKPKFPKGSKFTEKEKRSYLKSLTYEEKVAISKRPEEIDQESLYAPIWDDVNRHLGRFGIRATNHQDLVEQLGILRYGRRPRVGDAFSGSGSIPFEAARLGCDAYASDINPVACMLTWGAFNIVGASEEKRAEMEREQRRVVQVVDEEITALGIEHDSQGNRAKAYLYCLETRCPQTGWMVPMAPSWVISKKRNVVAKLVPDHEGKRFDIEICTGVSNEEMKAAERGTVRDGALVYELDGKTYDTPIRTLRGDHKDADGETTNNLRRWERHDFVPRPDDIYQERLYCIQWITRDTLNAKRQETFFASVTDEDLEREKQVEQIVAENLAEWQEAGYVPDMMIEDGEKTSEPIRTRGWTHWHHLFNARQLLVNGIIARECKRTPEMSVLSAYFWNMSSKLCRWLSIRDEVKDTFYSQALNTLYTYSSRSAKASVHYLTAPSCVPVHGEVSIEQGAAVKNANGADVWCTDPPYADAVHYHEITEFFIAWMRKNPPAPFSDWTWDSRRALAIKGSDNDFRRGMIEAYSNLAKNMPDNGLQCVMFTHQSVEAWDDMVAIFWAAGLQVVGAWYIATETISGLKSGGYVQGTVTLILKKRTAEQRSYRSHLLPRIKQEVQNQIETMLNLNEQAKEHGNTLFNDSDLQMAGYAAALKVLTSYTEIDGQDVVSLALKPRKKGKRGLVGEIVDYARRQANDAMIPEELSAVSKTLWPELTAAERFYVRMLKMEKEGHSKLDNYQNFAKAFSVDYKPFLASLSPNDAHLKGAQAFKESELVREPLGGTLLGNVLLVLRDMVKDEDAKKAVQALLSIMDEGFFAKREHLSSVARYLSQMLHGNEKRAKEAEMAEILADRLLNYNHFDN